VIGHEQAGQVAVQRGRRGGVVAGVGAHCTGRSWHERHSRMAAIDAAFGVNLQQIQALSAGVEFNKHKVVISFIHGHADQDERSFGLPSAIDMDLCFVRRARNIAHHGVQQSELIKCH